MQLPITHTIKKSILSLGVSCMLALVLSVLPASAQAALTLDKIGTDTVVSSTLTSWKTTQTNPQFSGTTDPDATLTITIGAQQSLAKADVEGNWLYTPTTLTEDGISSVSVTNGLDTISFDLEIAQAGTTSDTTTDTTTDTTDTTATTTATTTAATTEDMGKGGVATEGAQPTLPSTLPNSGANDVLWLLAGGSFFLLAGFMSRGVFAQLQAHD